MTSIEKATQKDFDTIFEIVNAAYSVNIGNNGRAFKTADRYTSKEMWKFKREMPLMWVLKEFTDSGCENIVGCIGAEVNTDGTMVTVGPIAVRPDSQGRGYSTKMLSFVERFAPIQKIGVVSCQDNLINMYKRKGYEIVEKEPMNDKNVPNISRNDLEFVIMLKNKSNK